MSLSNEELKLFDSLDKVCLVSTLLGTETLSLVNLVVQSSKGSVELLRSELVWGGLDIIDVLLDLGSLPSEVIVLAVDIAKVLLDTGCFALQFAESGEEIGISSTLVGLCLFDKALVLIK